MSPGPVERAVRRFGEANFESRRRRTWEHSDGMITQALFLEKSQVGAWYYLDCRIDFSKAVGSSTEGYATIEGRIDGFLSDDESASLKVLLNEEKLEGDGMRQEQMLVDFLEVHVGPPLRRLRNLAGIEEAFRQGVLSRFLVTRPAQDILRQTPGASIVE